MFYENLILFLSDAIADASERVHLSLRGCSRTLKTPNSPPLDDPPQKVGYFSRFFLETFISLYFETFSN